MASHWFHRSHSVPKLRSRSRSTTHASQSEIQVQKRATKTNSLSHRLHTTPFHHCTCTTDVLECRGSPPPFFTLTPPSLSYTSRPCPRPLTSWSSRFQTAVVFFSPVVCHVLHLASLLRAHFHTFSFQDVVLFSVSSQAATPLLKNCPQVIFLLFFRLHETLHLVNEAHPSCQLNSIRALAASIMCPLRSSVNDSRSSSLVGLSFELFCHVACSSFVRPSTKVTLCFFSPLQPFPCRAQACCVARIHGSL